jgi:hypothetical protein
MHWRSQLVDGDKCWYRSDRKLPNEDLIWSYGSKEFDEEDKVTGRKFFTPEGGIIRNYALSGLLCNSISTSVSAVAKYQQCADALNPRGGRRNAQAGKRRSRSRGPPR